jgi:hypothetical protein
MICAYVNESTGLVENTIVASPSDPVPAGYILVSIDNVNCSIGYTWDGTTFIPPEVI